MTVRTALITQAMVQFVPDALFVGPKNPCNAGVRGSSAHAAVGRDHTLLRM
jgi:hypothetical protein